MSRIGKQPVVIPGGVTVEIKAATNELSAKGPKGSVSMAYHPEMKLKVDAANIVVERPSEERRHRALHGLTRALVANQIKGVTEGFTRHLEIHGTGYSAQVQPGKLVLGIGFCHPIEIPFDDDISITAERGKPIKVVVSGIDKQKVGQIAARIRAVRPPDPYKQKGIRYAGEALIKKEGKAFGKK